MRITFVVPVLDVSGGARIVAGHARRLMARGHEVLIVAPTPRRPQLKQRVKILLGRESSPVPPERSHAALAQVPFRLTGSPGPVKSEHLPDADVVIGTWWETVEWIWILPAEKGAKVHFVQGYDGFFDHFAERVDHVWRLPTFKIAVAQWLADLGRERFGIEHMAIVPNSIDHELFGAKPRAKGEPPTIGFLFHEAASKDMVTTLAALDRLRQIRPDTKFLSFGACRPRRNQLPSGTEFHYFPAQKEIANIYSRCKAWLSTSRREGFNLPPLEAMGSGCPAVCAKTGRPLEIIQNGVNGFLVDQGDAVGFAEALAAILALPDAKWRKMSHEAIRSVAHPTWSESSELFEDALIRSLDEFPRPRTGWPASGGAPNVHF
jgi:glycosyltransferase involved in cell wall biosynthesis